MSPYTIVALAHYTLISPELLGELCTQWSLAGAHDEAVAIGLGVWVDIPCSPQVKMKHILRSRCFRYEVYCGWRASDGFNLDELKILKKMNWIARHLIIKEIFGGCAGSANAPSNAGSPVLPNRASPLLLEAPIHVPFELLRRPSELLAQFDPTARPPSKLLKL
jgi:hypothetical protein